MFREYIDKNTKMLSRAAQKGQRELEQINKYERSKRGEEVINYTDKELQMQILAENSTFYLNILLDNTYNAVNSREFGRNIKFLENLNNIIINNIDDILMAIVNYGVYGIYDIFEQIAGSANDFQEGIDAAREELEVTGGEGLMEKNRSYWYWRNIVWRNLDAYSETISARFHTWGDLAPYWYFLEHGNLEYKYAYPQFAASHFLSHSAYRITDDIEQRLFEKKSEQAQVSEEIEEINIEFQKEATNLFDQAVLDLQNRPEEYPPGYIWGIYTSLEDGRKYKVIRTKGGIVGRRKIK